MNTDNLRPLITILTTLGLIFILGSSFQNVSPLSERIKPELDLNACGRNNDVFLDGEKIVYKIYYNWNFIWIAAGEVIFEVQDLGDQYHISAVGRTFRSYDWVFKVRDYYDSFVAKKGLEPQRTIRSVHEGNYRLYDDVTYHHQKNLATSKKGKTIDDVQTEMIDLEQCTHDILSSIYTMRNIDFQSMPAGTRLPLSIYLDRKIYDVSVVYAGIEEDKRVKGLGKCNTMRFEPQMVVGNIFTEEEGMKVWVSNDQNRIPLLIESPISVGSVKCVMTEYHGLKYDADFEIP